MIHRESGVLCDATSLALNVFDISEGDAIRRERWAGTTNHWKDIVKGGCRFQEEESGHHERKEKEWPGRIVKASQPVRFLLKGAARVSAMGRQEGNHMLGEGMQQHSASVREDGPRGQSLDPCPPHTNPIVGLHGIHSSPLVTQVTVACSPRAVGQFWGTLDHRGEKNGCVRNWLPLCPSGRALSPSSGGRPAAAGLVGVLHQCSSQILDRVMCLSAFFSIQQPVPRARRPG